MSVYIFVGFLIVLSILLILDVYHWVQYFRKRNNMLVSTSISERHHNHAVTLLFVFASISILFTVTDVLFK